MDAGEIISALGGDRAVAEATGSARSTVVYWRLRGSIPSEHWEALVGLSGEKAGEITAALIRHAAARRLRRAVPA
jgi:hypothetical protein